MKIKNLFNIIIITILTGSVYSLEMKQNITDINMKEHITLLSPIYNNNYYVNNNINVNKNINIKLFHVSENHINNIIKLHQSRNNLMLSTDENKLVQDDLKLGKNKYKPVQDKSISGKDEYKIIQNESASVKNNNKLVQNKYKSVKHTNKSNYDCKQMGNIPILNVAAFPLSACSCTIM